MPTLTWDTTWAADSVLNNLVLAPGATAVGDLKNQSGKAISAVSVSLALVLGPKLDPREVFVGLVRDVDRTRYDTPPNLGDVNAPFPLRPVSGPLPQFGGAEVDTVLTVPSSFGSGFRVFVHARNPGATVKMSVRYKQA
jgi:hypothetical protein